ncbi:MAG: GMC family oxidoreductase [Acidobacteria bacterium]|nr:GMC family oxidoreductase [Acidobacteriota bacterium]
MAQAETYDLLVVGGGMAGCILATRIAEKGVHPRTGERLKVAMLERGPYFKGDPKLGYGIPLRRKMFTNITHEFREGGRYAMGIFASRHEALLRADESAGAPTADVASVVGGGSLHWQAMSQVPYDLDYEAWAEETGVDWTAEKVRPASEEIRTLFNIHARPESMLTRGDLLFRDTVKTLGYKIIEATLAKKNCIRCGFCNGADMCKYDAKMGPVITHLPLAEKVGVRIISDAEVEKIILEKQGARVVARGAIYRSQGSGRSALADNVIVSCGTFGTPLLLFRSGYGRREVLGSKLVVENPNIGRNIDARPSSGGVRGVFSEAMSDGDYYDGGYYFYQDVHPKGYVDRLEIGFGGELRTLPTPDLLAISRAAPLFGREHKEFMRQICNPSASGRSGRAALLREGTIDASVVRPKEVRGYLDEKGRFQYERNHPSIVQRLQEAREIARQVLEKMGAREILNASGPLRVGRETMQLGSCRAGADRSVSVVNSDFESHDVENLFICDGSALPRKASHGYGAPVATMATYAAQRIVARHFSGGS